MKITVLTENTSVKENIAFEHGLSLYIEAKNNKILFDMGETDIFYQNANTLGIDLSRVDLAVISHAHNDHTGGLGKFLEINKTAPVYLNCNAKGEQFGHEGVYIGIDPELKSNERIIYTDDLYEIEKGLTLYSCNKKERRFEFGSFGLCEKSGEEIIPDRFLHEQYLLIEEEGKRVLISGCSHKGILNIASWFKVDTIVGGFHFMHIEPGDLLKSYAEFLAEKKTEFLTCHCTGTQQFEFMKKYAENIHYISAGERLTL
ncbi:MAG: MBL fold metallo-hydrolase [Ruminococcaceae bacterium]|nr:MBL fold metallo-hydrolase [Oscillospiraceae bacterium]